MSSLDKIFINKDNLYQYKVKPLFNLCDFHFYRVKGVTENSGVADIYFFNETFSAWASLKTHGTFNFLKHKWFNPKWNRGEMVFLRTLAKFNTKTLVIIQLADKVYFSQEIKAKYVKEDLIPFELDKFYL